jgi:hypothetical protein
MDDRITDPTAAPPALEREAEPPSRFRYVLWSHASHDLPAGTRGRPRATTRAEGAAAHDGTAPANDMTGMREQR